jgi:hypothetical protein
MIYLTGSSNKNLKLRANTLGIGLMTQPDSGYSWSKHVPYYNSWAADNGCYAKGAEFDAVRWLHWLDQAPRKGCLFATAPDVVADAVATLARSRPYLAQIREMGFPVAFVAQDGINDIQVPWDEIDALFIGGTTWFKYSGACREVVKAAKQQGKWTHVGRVNSYGRLCYCFGMGVDSVDGNDLAFGPDKNLVQLVKWLERLHRPRTLFAWGGINIC